MAAGAQPFSRKPTDGVDVIKTTNYTSAQLAIVLLFVV